MTIKETWRRLLVAGLATVVIAGAAGCQSSTSGSGATTKPSPQRDDKGKPVTPPKADPG
jgi:hypothetical protein